MGVVVELSVKEVVLPNFDIKDVKFVFTVTVASHFSSGVYWVS